MRSAWLRSSKPVEPALCCSPDVRCRSPRCCSSPGTRPELTSRLICSRESLRSNGLRAGEREKSWIASLPAEICGLGRVDRASTRSPAVTRFAKLLSAAAPERAGCISALPARRPGSRTSSTAVARLAKQRGQCSGAISRTFRHRPQAGQYSRSTKLPTSRGTAELPSEPLHTKGLSFPSKPVISA